MGKRIAVRVDHFWAAYRAKGGSRQRLAKVAGVSHATLSRLASARGGRKAVSAATLEALSEALQVPAEWLTGAREDLPYVPKWAGQERKGPSLWERPTSDVVRWSWLMQRVEAALRRDLTAWHGKEAAAAYDSWGRALLEVFTELARFVSWRTACLETVSGSWDGLLPSDHSPSIDWLTHLLDPWFTGRAYLNADVLGRVFDALLANPQRLWESAIRDEDSRRALARYEEACSGFIAKRREEMYDKMAEWVAREEEAYQAARARAARRGRQSGEDQTRVP